MSSSFQRDALRKALTLEEPGEYGDLYRGNSEFYNGINTLAAVLPIFVRSLAEHSREQETKMRLLIEQENLTTRPIWIKGQAMEFLSGDTQSPNEEIVYCSACAGMPLVEHAPKCKRRSVDVEPYSGSEPE